MSAIKDQVMIDTTPDKAYAALTEQPGYLGWWSKDCQIADSVGGESRLRFDKQGSIVNMRFRIDAKEPKGRVQWTCISHDMNSWIGTTLNWTITGDAGGVSVALLHDGWQSETPPEMVAQGWKHFRALGSSGSPR